jgi:hypothetical protein
LGNETGDAGHLGIIEIADATSSFGESRLNVVLTHVKSSALAMPDAARNSAAAAKHPHFLSPFQDSSQRWRFFAGAQCRDEARRLAHPTGFEPVTSAFGGLLTLALAMGFLSDSGPNVPEQIKNVCQLPGHSADAARCSRRRSA